MIPYALSFYDLMKYKPFKQAVENNDKQEFNKILYQGGMEVDLGYDIVEILHRPSSNKEPWFGPRVEGFERVDELWLSTPNASLEAHIGSIPDYTKRVELKLMSKTSCSEQAQDMLERAAYSEARKVSKQLSKEG